MQRTFMVSNGYTFKPNGSSSARIVSYLLAARNFVQITFKTNISYFLGLSIAGAAVS